MRLIELPHDAGHDREGHAFLSVLSGITVSGRRSRLPSTIVFCRWRVQPLPWNLRQVPDAEITVTTPAAPEAGVYQLERRRKLH